MTNLCTTETIDCNYSDLTLPIPNNNILQHQKQPQVDVGTVRKVNPNSIENNFVALVIAI